MIFKFFMLKINQTRHKPVQRGMTRYTAGTRYMPRFLNSNIEYIYFHNLKFLLDKIKQDLSIRTLHQYVC